MRLLLVALVFTAILQSQTKPNTNCADLRSMTNNELTIAITVSVPESADAPAHCRVVGQLLPTVGFEVQMPADWNGRFVMFGNGGFAGDALEARGRQLQFGRAMRRGYATAATDTGHSAATEPAATFAANRQKLYDYAFRSLHVTADAAKLLLRTYYGTAPAKSYFEGCSTGGRQGLILAQRFPDDFDGITVGAPVLNFTGTMLRFVQMAKSSPLPPAKLAVLTAKVYESCDA